MTTRFARYQVLGLLALFLAIGVTAYAQVTPKTAAPEDQVLQEVVVTGSRISRPEFDNVEPTTSIDSKASINVDISTSARRSTNCRVSPWRPRALPMRRTASASPRASSICMAWARNEP